MGRVGDGEHGRALGDALLGQAVVHVGGRQQAEADVMVFGVVPDCKLMVTRWTQGVTGVPVTP